MKKSIHERFPAVALSLSLLPIKHPYEIFRDKRGHFNAKRKKRGKVQYLYGEDSQEEIENWFKTLQLEKVEIVYIYGLALGFYFEPLKAWIEKEPRHRIVFIEDDLAVIDAFIKADLSPCFDNPKVHLHFISEASKWKESLEILVSSFPSDLLIFTPLKAYSSQKKVEAMRLCLQRRASLMDVLFTEVMYAPFLFKNLHPHFKKIPESFFANRWRGRFENIPAIICGAGPSLSKEIETLKQVGDRALLFAGGSALTALTFQQVMPHIGIAIDPSSTEYDRLKESTAFEIPLIFAPRLFPKVEGLFNGPWGYLHSDTGGKIEYGLVRKLQLKETPIGPDLGCEALSVMTLSVALACAMGCNPIIFVGVDLAFTDNQSYALGVVEDVSSCLDTLKKEPKAIDQLVKLKDRKGKPIYTLVKWIMESETISRYAKVHPETQFINSTEGGIGFSDIEYRPLAEVIESDCTLFYNLQGLLHAESEENRWTHCRVEEIEAWFNEVKQSLERMHALIEEMLINTSEGRQALLELDFQEELAFDCFFQGITSIEQYKTMIKSYLETLSK